MKKIAIIGSKDLGQQITHLIQNDSKTLEVVGFYDDFAEKGLSVKHVPILGKISDIETDFNNQIFDELIVAIGYQHFAFKRQVFEKFLGKIPFATYIHSSCIIDQSAVIKPGTVIYPGCVIDQNVTLEENVLLNLSCNISHDSVVGAHSYLSPRVAIAGKVQIGECCFFGINTTVIDHIKIIAQTFVGAASNVVKNIESTGVYFGNPVKKIEKTK